MKESSENMDTDKIGELKGRHKRIKKISSQNDLFWWKYQ
jgi:hypothetical protein